MSNCQKCNDTGLIPFKNKEGTIIPHTFIDCDCKEPEQERYHPIFPEDCDFPMSDTFRGFPFENCGVPDPGYVQPHHLKPAEPEPEWNKRQWGYVQQLESRVLRAEGKLNTHLDKSRQTKKADNLKVTELPEVTEVPDNQVVTESYRSSRNGFNTIGAKL